MIKVRVSLKGICIAAFVLFASNAFAQCATGVNTGGGNCVPPNAAGMPGYNAGGNASVAAPQAVWEKTWGAIAVDSTTGKAGTVTDRSSQSQASTDALQECRANGGANCKLEMAYTNQCAAIGWGTQGWGSGRGPDKASAEGIAMEKCNDSTDGCKVVYSACSLSRRVR